MIAQTRLLPAALGACACLVVLGACAVKPEYPVATVESAIMTVSQWGGTPADETNARQHAITRITLHHQGVAFPRGSDPVQYLRNLQVWSRDTQKWLDVPYHYVIDLDGNIYAGRDIRFAGDTNTEYDPAGHALIEIVGNYEESEPSQSQLDAVVELMVLLAEKHSISVDAIRGHRDFSGQTVCPGKNLYRYLENGYFRERVRTKLATKHPGPG